MDTHNPTWMDLQQLMGMLFNPEEREKIRNVVSKILKPTIRSLEEYVENKFPSTDPQWDPYSRMDTIKDYQNLVVQAVHASGKPAVNMSKPSLVMQGANESPEAFYTQLLEAYQMYTPIDPTEPENAWMLAMTFISQSVPDIRRKLQRLEGALGKSISELMEVARKTFANHDKVEERKQDQKMQRKAELLAAAIMGIPRGRGGSRGRGLGVGLGRNQCAICKKEGHWKGECLEKDKEEVRNGRRGGFVRNYRGGCGRTQGGRGRGQGFSGTPLMGLAEVEEWD